MEIFKELTKKGYKHYYEGTIEELDLMDKNNPNLHSEIMQVIMWLYEKHRIWIYTSQNSKGLFQWYFDYNAMGDRGMLEFNSPTEAYEAAIEYVLKNILM